MERLERTPQMLLAGVASSVSTALAELLASDSLHERVALLSSWKVHCPNATALLLEVIIRSPAASLELATAVLGCEILDEDQANEILAGAFPKLTGAVRDAAADRPGVRALLDIPEGIGYAAVPAPDPEWLWPKGQPFPPAKSVEGIQARLNYLGLGAGPVTGEWNERTNIAFARWQVLNGFDSTIERDYQSVEYLAFDCPDAPD